MANKLSLFKILLVCLLCLPCVAIVEDVTCSTSDPSNCTTYGDAECDGNTCLCKINHYDDELTCQLKKNLGVACTDSVQCSDTKSECGSSLTSSICYCKSMFYDSNNSILGGICKPFNELKVTNLAITTRSETFLEVEWTAPTATSAIEEFRYQVSSGAVISVNKETTANITGLTSGSLYTIKIISVDTNSGPNVQTTYVEISIATRNHLHNKNSWIIEAILDCILENSNKGFYEVKGIFFKHH